jgi:hypothetical protein
MIVAGAIVPVSRISFPFQFRINAKNAIRNTSSLSPSPQDTWNDVMQNNDLLVKAVVCSRDTIENENGSNKNRNIYELLDTCQSVPTDINGLSSTLTSTPLRGEGIAKLIRYSNNNSNITNAQPDLAGPSMSGSRNPKDVIIRAPVSLPLG